MHSLHLAGHTDSRWRRRFFALKGSQLCFFRTAEAAKPLGVIGLIGAQITASKHPIRRDGYDGSSGSSADNNGDSGSEMLYILKLTLQQQWQHPGAAKYCRYKLAAASRELQVSLCSGG